MKNNNRSPITDKPLRNPGQSLEEQRRDLFEEQIGLPVLITFVMVWFVGVEWWYYFHPATRNPIILTLIAIMFVAYTAFRVWRTWPKLRQLQQGIEGEKAVGQFLENLRSQGYQVFHDLVGNDFNVDHVIIGPAGVFTIETKTISKPMRGDVKIQFDGETIQINGRTMDRNPVRQAKAQASWLKKILQDSTGREFRVRPVVVFPGWFVEPNSGSSRELWVLSHKALPKFLENAPEVLSAEEVRMASGHLSRFIRAQEI